MLRKASLASMLVILAYGFWISPDFKEISAGVAIFLFGMLSLEEGFKAFTGGLLEKLLRQTTDRTWKSLAFGVVSTTLMQSSSLVSVITISFLSAGLIGLAAGIGIIYGANLGTTTGAWLIAAFGMKVDIAGYAMPMLVFGIIGVFQSSRSFKGLGYILSGLGFLFLGIHYMKEGFEAFRGSIDLAALSVDGYLGVLLFTLAGVLATVIMQSSHATLVIIITALAAQQVTYENALALAIGANIGTTITAILGSMSANVQGKRLAIAHLIFNVATAAIAIVFIYQLTSVVDWISGEVGIAGDDYTLKLAVFHSVFNGIGILMMLPFISQLADALTRFMPEQVLEKDQPKYLTPVAMELPDTAIEAVRQETLHLYDNAFTIIAHGLSFQEQEILSSSDLKALVRQGSKVLPVDFDLEYNRAIKDLYSAIVQFISRSATSMSMDQSDELFGFRAAGHDICEAIKDTKHMHKNLSRYIVSDNSYIRTEYNKIRVLLGGVMRTLSTIREFGDDSMAILSLDNLKLEIAQYDKKVNSHLDQLIRDNHISATMATSLMNDSSYALDVAKNLIQSAEVLFSASAYDVKQTERSIALSNDELIDILQKSDGK